MWKVCIPSGHVSFSAFTPSVWVCALSSDSCHLQELWLHRKLWSMWGLLSCGSRGICRLLVQGIHTFRGETSKACSCCSNLGKQNSVSVAVSLKLLSWPFLMNMQLNVCVCSVSKSVFFVFFSGCLRAPLPQVYMYLSQWSDINEESWKRWGWSLAFRLLFARILLSSLLRLRPERRDVCVVYASVTLSCPCVLHVCCIANIFCLWKNT